MTIRHIALAAVTAAALSPAISNASPERLSAQACASAFAASLASPGAAAPGVKLDYRAGEGSTYSAFVTTEATFALVAHDSKTGAVIARANCSTNAHGEVRAIALLPAANILTALQ